VDDLSDLRDALSPLNSIALIAELLQVSHWTVRKLIARGDLRVRHVGSRVLIPRQAVIDYLEGRK